jgi:hypothetical protein
MNPRCRVCARRLNGRIRRWGGKIMCLRCFKHFSRHYRLVRGGQNSRKGGILSWLFG